LLVTRSVCTTTSTSSASPICCARGTLIHFHLMSKENVVGTAVGYYLIRDSDPLPDQLDPKNSRPQYKPERTFWNSAVRDYSWPCVLVMVSKWEGAEQFGSGKPYAPTDMVPKTLYLDYSRGSSRCRGGICAACSRCPRRTSPTCCRVATPAGSTGPHTTSWVSIRKRPGRWPVCHADEASTVRSPNSSNSAAPGDPSGAIALRHRHQPADRHPRRVPPRNAGHSSTNSTMPANTS